MAYAKELFGKMPDGRQVELYTLTNGSGTCASFTDLGGIWVSMQVPDRDGKFADVALGYDTVEKYLNNAPHLGAIIGRNSNRIANGRFLLNGAVYRLRTNDGPNNLHSGPDLYHDRLWDVDVDESSLGTRISFTLNSPDGDQGYPGNAQIGVDYTLTEDDSIRIEYHMVCDQDTVANMTNHSYFNLAGHRSGRILDQEVRILADHYTPVDENLIPTGQIAQVAGTPMDFREFKPIGKEIEAACEQLKLAGGYDHNWVLNHPRGEVALAAVARDPKSGRQLEVYTDLPGMQFYTGNFLTGEQPGKEGACYGRRTGYCFETQYYPDAPNKPEFPSPVLKAGEEYKTTTIYHFMAV